MKNEIQTYEKMNDLPSVQALGKVIAESGMFGCKKPEQGIIIALQCIAENKPPLEMAKNYHIVTGKLTKRTDAMLADFKKIGGKFVWNDLQLKNKKVQSATFTDPDGNAYKVSYSIEDAKSAGVYSENPDSSWQKTPAAMLRARLISETLRAIAPETVTGVYTPEEASQFDDVQPTQFTETKQIVIKGNATVEDLKQVEGVKVTAQPVIEAETVKDTEKNTFNQQFSQVSRYKLERFIFEAKAEDKVNAYYTSKNAIDPLIEQTWRDLPAHKLQHLFDNWESFKAAVLNK